MFNVPKLAKWGRVIRKSFLDKFINDSNFSVVMRIRTTKTSRNRFKSSDVLRILSISRATLDSYIKQHPELKPKVDYQSNMPALERDFSVDDIIRFREMTPWKDKVGEKELELTIALYAIGLAATNPKRVNLIEEIKPLIEKHHQAGLVYNFYRSAGLLK